MHKGRSCLLSSVAPVDNVLTRIALSSMNIPPPTVLVQSTKVGMAFYLGQQNILQPMDFYRPNKPGKKWVDWHRTASTSFWDCSASQSIPGAQNAIVRAFKHFLLYLLVPEVIKTMRKHCRKINQ